MVSRFSDSRRRAGQNIGLTLTPPKSHADVVDIDAAVAQHLDELIVFPLRPLHPENVIEEQFIVIGRRQTLEAQLRTMDKDFSQLSDFGIDAELPSRRGRRLAFANRN